MPGPNDPYQYNPSFLSSNHPFWQNVQNFTNSPTAQTIGKVLGYTFFPGPMLTRDAAKRASGGQPFQFTQNLPVVDYLMNPQKYPTDTTLFRGLDLHYWKNSVLGKNPGDVNTNALPGLFHISPEVFTTTAQRQQQEQAGTWVNTLYSVKESDDPVQIANQFGISPQQLLNANPGGAPFSTGQTVHVPQFLQPQPQPAQANDSDYSRTRAAQAYARDNTPFLAQQRWDPQARKYVSIARLLKQGKLDIKGNWYKQSRRQRRNDNAARRNKGNKQDMTLANSLIAFGASSG